MLQCMIRTSGRLMCGIVVSIAIPISAYASIELFLRPIANGSIDMIQAVGLMGSMILGVCCEMSHLYQSDDSPEPDDRPRKTKGRSSRCALRIA